MAFWMSSRHDICMRDDFMGVSWALGKCISSVVKLWSCWRRVAVVLFSSGRYRRPYFIQPIH